MPSLYTVLATCSYTFFTGRRSRSSAVVSWIRNGTFKPSGVRQKDIKCVFKAVLHNVNSSVGWIKSLPVIGMEEPTQESVDLAKDMPAFQFLSTIHKKFIGVCELGTYPHHSTFLGGRTIVLKHQGGLIIFPEAVCDKNEVVYHWQKCLVYA